MPGGGPDDQASSEVSFLIGDPLSLLYRYPLCNRLLVEPLSRTPITANQVSALHVAVGVVGAAFLAQGARFSLVLAALLFEVQRILDCLDGSLARRKGTASKGGELIEAIADGMVYTALSLGAVVYLLRRTSAAEAWLCVLGVAVVLLTTGLLADHYAARLKERSERAPSNRDAASVVLLVWVGRLLWSENVALILGLGMLLGHVKLGFQSGLVYGAVIILTATLVLRKHPWFGSVPG